MEYINNTDEAKKVRLIEKTENGVHSYMWVTVRPGKNVELNNAVQAKNLGLTLVPSKKADGEENAEGNEVSEEEQAANIVEAYKKKLLGIKGLGNKTVDDIISLYPRQEDLVEAINLGKKIAVRDDIEAALREEFK